MIIVDSVYHPINEIIFTQEDLIASRVSYVHDGSESTVDKIGIQLEFRDTVKDPPPKFQHKHGFTLPVKVIPVNDNPEIIFPENENLIMVANTQITLTPSLLRILDPDDPPSNLEYIVYYTHGADVGYFERLGKNGVRARILKFTQDDINEGRIEFIHRGKLNQNIGLLASDGKDASEKKTLKIVAVPLLLSTVFNTGSIVARNSSVIISKENLTFVTNAPNQNLDIRYTITDPPYEGELQKHQYTDNKWVVVTTFTQDHVDKGRVRYVHYNESGFRGDYFRFKANAMHVESAEFEFPISIIDAKVELMRNKRLQLIGVRDRTISWEELKSTSSLPYHGPQNIEYVLVTVPSKGSLYKLETNDNDFNRKLRLIAGSRFSQAEVNNGQVFYRLNRALYNTIEDEFRFVLAASGIAPTSAVYTFSVAYEPDAGKIRFTNNGISDVMEGESMTITPYDLYIEIKGIEEFMYEMTSFPRHGIVMLVEPETNVVIIENVTTFNNEDIASGRVLYVHDDSETVEDAFGFAVSPQMSLVRRKRQAPLNENYRYKGVFEIGIVLKNDNPPRRVVDRVFYVVTNRGRVLSLDDIRYEDPDIDFDSLDLEYTWQSVSNGMLVLASNRSLILYRFTQRDIAEGIVYLQHRDAASGKSVIWVSDGRHHTTGLLEIRASDPFVKINNNTGLKVELGGSVGISPSNLDAITNEDLDGYNLTFFIKQNPSHGIVTVRGRLASHFTVTDIRRGDVEYKHDGSQANTGRMTLKVQSRTTYSNAFFRIDVAQTHQNQPSFHLFNKGATVSEFGVYTISDQNLLATYEDASPTDIQYSIISYPKFGRIFAQIGNANATVVTFTQEDLYSGRLRYEHLNELGHEDSFTFDVLVYNIKRLANATFHLEMIPEKIPLEVADILVKEGDRVYLSKNKIMLPNRYYQTQDVEIVIVKTPAHGRIEFQASPGKARTQFTLSQVRAWSVLYSHDGSDTLQDKFSMIARLRGSPNRIQSDPRTIRVTVLPVNDKRPELVVNERLEVWKESITPITEKHLEATDQDSRPDEIVYVITQKPASGMVALSTRLPMQIANFTQFNINLGLIIYIHAGLHKLW